MEQYIITIDTGTTNTRTILWDANRNIIHTEKAAVGVRNTAIDGNNSRLKAAVKGCLDALIEKSGIQYQDVARVIASGMITSNVGLVEIPHVTAPAGLEQLAAAAKAVELPDVCPLPIWFIPGIKNACVPSLENFEKMDIMRGEEVESIAIIERCHEGDPMLLVLPGSHTKFVSVDSNGQITGCLTSIAGELLSSITNDTIIADAVGHQFVTEEQYDKDMLLTGYRTAQKSGIGRACFSGRILNQFVTKDKMQVANYILGVVLQSDVIAIKNSDALTVDKNTSVVVCGKSPLKEAIADILEYDGTFKKVIRFEAEDGLPLSALGAYAVAEKSNIL